MSRGQRTISLSSVVGAMLLLVVASAHGQDSTTPPVQTVYSGGELFRNYCAACHGTSAHGDGPLASNMKKRPPDLTKFAARNGGVFPAAMVGQIIDGRQPVKGHGGPDMPVWGDVFKASRVGSSEEAAQAMIQAIVEFLDRIQERRAE